MGRQVEERRIAGLDLGTLGTAYQPIVDLRDGATVGYEALMRGPEHSPLARPEQLFAAARAEDRVADLDLAGRDAAVRRADEHGLSAPFSLFVNADADTLLETLPERPGARSTLFQWSGSQVRARMWCAGTLAPPRKQA